MKKMKRRLLPALIIALLAIPTFAVLAKEMGSLTVSGPGIKGELSVSDPKFTLEQTGFFDQSVQAEPSKDLNRDAGYNIMAYLNLDGKIVPFAQMVYYATSEGQPAYVHYTGSLQGETLRPVDEWYTLSRTADAAFRALMTANNVTIQSAIVAAPVKSESPANAPAASAAEPVVAPVTSSAPIQSTYIVLAIAATVILLAGVGMVIRRRNVRTAS